MYCKLVILGTSGMLDYDSQNGQKTLMFIFMQKKKKNNRFPPHFFLEILLRYCKLVILGTLGMPGHADFKQ